MGPQALRDKKIREVRKAQGKAQKHKEMVKAVSGPARSKKTQKRLAHKAKMLERHIQETEAGQAAGDGAEAAAAVSGAPAGAAAAAAGKKGRRARPKGKGATAAGGGAAAAAAGDAMQE
ncbi:hypothetical protein MNEG_8953 [Monoraphidium neglectum]|jgi:outer membrane biosynthesis protein TonB|uniref:Uncharacterized protein n=1 Tax=Monoraphidium neglectum TaxID=145388 RepID=A0A0D2ME36_9CHLO|nr:hypothetical protein MNEG_8953 [Monoraphidium neglectum]KIY99011.1 hypothetical protein MNEG_8953 [Monoraphidium neglectum]|eukprot:XP_013898031.1 hypothetical protein MNEG_8953 [Monoraphidium neglectum]